MKLRLGINRFSLEYDTDYGIDKQKGWTTVWGGSVVTEFNRTPFTAIYKLIVRAFHTRGGREW